MARSVRHFMMTRIILAALLASTAEAFHLTQPIRHRSTRALACTRVASSEPEPEPPVVDATSAGILPLTRRQAVVAAAVSAVVTAGGAAVPEYVWAGEGEPLEPPSADTAPVASPSSGDSGAKSFKVKAAWAATDGFVDEQFISFDEAQYKVSSP